MPPPDLFEGMRNAKRARLLELGWYRPLKPKLSGAYWLSPSGATLSEDEAFAWLERFQASEAKQEEG